MTGRGLASDRARHLLLADTFWVVLDALDEVRGANVDTAIEEIIEFLREFPSCRIVASCRSAQVPPWAPANFRIAQVQPLSLEQAQDVLGQTLRDVAIVPDQSSLADQLVELCTNPLMLGITQELLLAGKHHVLTISSAAQLLDLFVDLLEDRERSKRPSAGDLEDRLAYGFGLQMLAYIAWKMLAHRLAAITQTQMGDWLSEFLAEQRWTGWWGDGPRPSVAELIAYLSRRPPFKQVATLGAASQLSFMHLTFRDAFAGRYLDSLRSRASDADVLDDHILDENQIFWSAIVFLAGRDLEPGRTTRHVIDLAFASRRQELLLLASRCAQGRWDTPSEDIADLLLAVLDAFKNWDKAFDYDLMRSGRSLLDRLDADFPRRLRDDLVYFTDKYAVVVPRAITSASVEQLLEFLDDRDAGVVINALYSLGQCRYPSNALRDATAQAIQDHLPNWVELIQDQAVAALKDIASAASLHTLRDIADDAAYSYRARAFALNAVADIGVADDFPLITRLLLDHSFRYRDSASWSMQRLTRRFATKIPGIMHLAITEYFRALQAETPDAPGRYAKGNILYSLGVLNAITLRAQIQEFLQTESDSYVIEDGLLCLGLLGQPASLPYIEECISYDDPAVRVKAAEALVSCGSDRWDLIEQLQTDAFRIVQRAAAELLARHTAATETVRDPIAAFTRVLARGPIRSHADKETFRLGPGERELIERAMENLQQQLSSVPSFLGEGPTGELRISVQDADTLRAKLNLPARSAS